MLIGIKLLRYKKVILVIKLLDILVKVYALS